MAFGFNFSKSKSQSTSSSQSRSFVDPSQQPFLGFLRNEAQNLFGETQGDAQQLQGLAQNLIGGGQDFLGQLGQLAGPQQAQQGVDIGSFGQELGANPFTQALGQFGTGGATQFATQQLGQDVSRNLFQSILPGLEQSAVAQGGLGGSRGGIAAGLASQGAQQAFGQGAAQIGLQGLGLESQALQAGGQLFQGQQGLGVEQGLGQAGLAVQQALGLGGLNLQQQGLQSQAALGGLSQLGGLFDIGAGGLQALFQPLLAAADVIGPANILQQSQSQAQSTGSSKAFGVSGG